MQQSEFRTYQYSAERTSEPPLKNSSSLKSKSKLLPKLEISQFIVKINIERVTELFAVAEERRKECQADFSAFVLPCTRKPLNDRIENSWLMHSTKTTIEKEKT